MLLTISALPGTMADGMPSWEGVVTILASVELKMSSWNWRGFHSCETLGRAVKVRRGGVMGVGEGELDGRGEEGF